MLYLELWYSVENYNVRGAATQLSAQGTKYFQMKIWNYSSTGDSYFPIRTAKMAHWIFYILLKVYIWDLGLRLANPFWYNAIQISIIDRLIFSKYFPNYKKLKSFVETLLLNHILIFHKQLCMSNYVFLYLILTRPKCTGSRKQRDEGIKYIGKARQSKSETCWAEEEGGIHTRLQWFSFYYFQKILIYVLQNFLFLF